MKNLRALMTGAFTFLGFSLLVGADDAALPGAAFDPSRYHALWENSPFAVATPVAVESEEYSLVGAAQFDGVAYASIVDRQNSDHFVVTSATPAHGLSLVSLVRGQTADSTFATLQKNGSMLRLKLETTPVAGSAAPAPAPMVMNAPIASPVYSSGIHRRPPRARIFNRPIFVPRPPPN